VIFTLASKLRVGDSVYLGSSSRISRVLAVTALGSNVRIVTETGSAELAARERVRIR
jgi:hypothetical protein